MKVFLAAFCALAVCGSIQSAKLQEKFQWKEMTFNWPSEAVKQEYTTSRRYIPENNLPLAIEIWRDKLFVTIPR